MAKIKTKKILLWICLPLLGLVLAAAAGAYIYLQRNAPLILKKYQAEIEKECGLRLDLKKLDVSLLPFPAISVSQASLSKGDLSLETGWIHLRPVLSELVRGRFAPAQLTLLRPRLAGEAPFPLTANALAGIFSGLQDEKKTFAFPPGALGEMFGEGCEIEIRQGECFLSDSTGAALHLTGFDCRIDLNSRGAQGEASFVALNLREKGALAGGVERFSLSGRLGFADPAYDARLGLRMQAIVPGLIGRSQIAVDYEGARGGRTADFAVSGDFDMGATVMPFEAGGVCSQKAGEPVAAFKNVNLFLDADKGSLNGVLTLPTASRPAEFAGSARFTRLSLTQWLGFARNLMPGLALALDNVTDAAMDFTLTPKGVTAPALSGCALGFCFRGEGGVADFAKPNVYLNMESDFVNVARAIPESAGVFPDAPAFSHPTLTPMPGSPTPPGETGVDYDISLGAKEAVYGPLKITDGKIRITQGKMDVTGLEDVLLYFDGKGYGGSLKGLCILGGDPSLPMAISGTLNGFQAARLYPDLPLLPFRAGALGASFDIKGVGKRLAPFLASLRGDLAITAAKPVLRLEDAKIALNSAEAKLSIKKGELRENRLGLDGKWSLAFSSADFSGKGDFNGLIRFDAASREPLFQNLPLKATLEAKEKASGVKNGVKLALSANASCDGKKIELARASITLPEISLTGGVSVTTGKNLAYQGSAKLSVGNLPALLEKYFAKKVALPSHARPLSAEGRFSGKDKQCALENLKGKWGTAAFSGKMNLDFAKSFPMTRFDLFLDKFIADQGGAKKSAQKSAWDFAPLRKIDTTGTLSIGEIRAYGLKFTKCSLPLSLRGGKLTASRCAAVFYGANMHLDGTADFGASPGFSGKLEVLAFNLNQAARDQKLKSLLTGYADLTANMAGKLTDGQKFLTSLDGSWSVRLKNGSWQKLDAVGKPEGKATPITLASASGSLKNGIARSSNLLLQNSSLKLSGAGSINLQTKAVEGNFEVDMKGLPDFPLKISGTLDKPKTSIGTGKMILNFISGVTGGVVDIFASIGSGILNVFR